MENLYIKVKLELQFVTIGTLLVNNILIQCLI